MDRNGQKKRVKNEVRDVSHLKLKKDQSNTNPSAA